MEEPGGSEGGLTGGGGGGEFDFTCPLCARAAGKKYAYAARMLRAQRVALEDGGRGAAAAAVVGGGAAELKCGCVGKLGVWFEM